MTAKERRALIAAHDEALFLRGIRAAGIDEAGRGPLAGPVVAACVMLPDGGIEGLDDSKKLSAAQRERLCDEIFTRATIGIGMASVEEILAKNILGATLLAMRRAAEDLPLAPDVFLVDGTQLPTLPAPAEGIIGGDGKSACIAAASIVAKVMRDRMMGELDLVYPEYGFAAHKGYGTPAHLRALDEHGPSPVHRAHFLRKIFAHECV